MPLTIGRTGFRDLDVAGIRRRNVVLLTGPVSYVGDPGEPLTPGDVKLGTIECFGAGGVVFENGAGAIRIAYYDIANQRLRFYVPNTGSQVAAAQDLSLYTARVEIIGK